MVKFQAIVNQEIAFVRWITAAFAIFSRNYEGIKRHLEGLIMQASKDGMDGLLLYSW